MYCRIRTLLISNEHVIRILCKLIACNVIVKPKNGLVYKAPNYSTNDTHLLGIIFFLESSDVYFVNFVVNALVLNGFQFAVRFHKRRWARVNREQKDFLLSDSCAGCLFHKSKTSLTQVHFVLHSHDIPKAHKFCTNWVSWKFSQTEFALLIFVFFLRASLKSEQRSNFLHSLCHRLKIIEANCILCFENFLITMNFSNYHPVYEGQMRWMQRDIENCIATQKRYHFYWHRIVADMCYLSNDCVWIVRYMYRCF